MILLSCTNCAYNALQHDTVGTTVGYCTEHRRVLNTPGELTCGRQFRKDLPLASATRQQELHEVRFTPSTISSLMTRRPVNGAHTSSKNADLAPLAADPVGAAVTQYGRLDTKMESLAQLAVLPGARSHIALASLGRTYVRRCMARNGKWTSGLHIFWWVRKRIEEEPDVRVEDLRVTSAVPLGRQVDLARWSIVMLKLTFLADVGEHARDTSDRVRVTRDLLERAAEATGELSFRQLMRWVRGEGRRILDAALPEDEYERRSRELHKDDA